MARPASLAKERLTTEALVLRLVPYRDSDAIVHLFTDQEGAMAAMARGARRSRRRFTSLEPMHTLRVTVDVTPGRELATLVETSMTRPRIGLTTRLSAMEAAGRALRWLRRAAAPRTPEPGLWSEVVALLDDLDDGAAPVEPEALLAGAGLRMLSVAGWQLELARCLRCGKACPERARTVIDVRAGGVVCRNCGAAGVTVSSRQRHAMITALEGGPLGSDAGAVIAIVDQAFEAHGRGEAT